MIRHALTVVVAMSMGPAWAYAETSVFTVHAVSADVHKAPSTGSPVIGQASRGSAFPVTRELGSWVKVSWPKADDGFGYIHVTMGSLVRNVNVDASRPVAERSPQPPTETTGRPIATRVDRPVAAPQPSPTRVLYLQPPTHLVGLGGRAGGSTVGFGASARVWSRDQFGVQFDVSRVAVTGIAPTERVSSFHLEPGVLYAVKEHVADYLWVRPYVGSGIAISRRSLSSTTPGAVPVDAQQSFNVQLLGGSELTFVSVPRLAFSVDVAYRLRETTFAGVDFGRVGLSVAGRWYVR